MKVTNGYFQNSFLEQSNNIPYRKVGFLRDAGYQKEINWIGLDRLSA